MTGSTDADRTWLRRAIDLSRRCRPTTAAYCVGAVIVAADGTPLADGYSRDTDPYVHAEESAIAKLAAHAPVIDLAGATIYSSLEPCSIRRSRPQPCAQLILATGIGRLVYALREPPALAAGHGADLLRAGGLDVVELAELGDFVRDINAAVLATEAPDRS